MSAVLYVDVVGGAAGDMLLAALLDAGAPMSAVQEAVDAVLPGRFAIETKEVQRGGLRARLLRAEDRRGDGGGLTGEVSVHQRAGRHFMDLLETVERAPLDDDVRRRAKAVLNRLGSAESRVHRVGLDALSLHQLGEDDTLLDVVGVSAALAALGVDRMLVSDIPLGTGPREQPERGHDRVPLPASATLELLRGFRIRDGGTGETVTPTAAAIFSALGRPEANLPDMVLRSIGYGAGTRDPDDYPNLVRVLLGDEPPTGGDAPSADGARRVGSLTVLEANLDDMTPELVADAVQALLAAGALDVWTTPIQMKKGRPALLLSLLCEPAQEEVLREEFFRHTSTFGVRSYRVQRRELERRTVSVAVGQGTVRVKVGLIDGRIATATPEHDDVADLAKRIGRPVRTVYEEATTAARELL